MEFSKDLSPSEIKYKYLGLTKTNREGFPEKDELFDVKFKGKVFKMKVSGKTKDSIMLTPLYSAHEFKEGDTLTIKSAKKGFDFSVE